MIIHLLNFHILKIIIDIEGYETNYKDFIESNPHIVPWRTEMMVWDEEYKLAGSIDMIFIDLNTNELIIVDWKRSKEIKKTIFKF